MLLKTGGTVSADHHLDHLHHEHERDGQRDDDHQEGAQRHELSEHPGTLLAA